MRKAIMMMLFAVLTLGAMAQSKEQKTDAVFPGGEKAMKAYLQKNLQYPEQAAQYGVEGSVIMIFTVEKDGSLKDIVATECKIERFNTSTFGQETEARKKELKRQFAKLFAKEGVRVVRKMPKWEPLKKDGEAVSSKCYLPIHFGMPNK